MSYQIEPIDWLVQAVDIDGAFETHGVKHFIFQHYVVAFRALVTLTWSASSMGFPVSASTYCALNAVASLPIECMKAQLLAPGDRRWHRYRTGSPAIDAHSRAAINSPFLTAPIAGFASTTTRIGTGLLGSPLCRSEAEKTI